MADIDKLQKDAVASIASVSTLLRNAIGASLPVAPEQYLTIAIPGTVIDMADYDQGGSFVYDVAKHATPPTTVRQSEGRLVDGMMPISKIMIGNTGKSVARSYSRSLDGLIPAKADISSSTGIRSSGNKSYKDAMAFLRESPTGTHETVVDVYCRKQKAWGEARSAWDKGKNDAEAEAEQKFPPGSSPDFIGKQKQYVNDWNQEHFYFHKAAVQAAWMDWVVNGYKYDVDFNFGLIDIDSIMQRVEASKESLRNSTIPDSDGASEIYGVSLTPNRWATYCKRKAEGWYARNGGYTLGQLDAEIARLTSLLDSYDLAATTITDPNKTYPITNPTEPTIKPIESRTALEAKTKALYTAQGALAGAVYNGNQLKAKPGATDEEKTKAQADVDAAKKTVEDSEKEVQDAQAKAEETRNNWNEFNRLRLEGDTLNEATGWISAKKATISKELDRLNDLRTAKTKASPVTVPVITGATAPKDDQDKTTTHGLLIAAEGAEIASPIFDSLPVPQPASDAPGGTTAPSASAEDADPWTTITFSYSASDLKNHSEESSWGMSVGGSVGFGLWSVGGSYSHDESHSSMQSDMAACDVSVSFSALVVNINRPWLFGELFSDIDLELADGVKLSPGPLALQKMIDAQKVDDIAMYSQFPAYPTSFIVAADTTIEFTGSTKHIEQQFDSHSNSGSVSVGYGPFSVSGSFHESASSQSMQVQSTATGCKLSFGAPQVIGWISQILPTLPRPTKFNPLTQGAGLPLPS